MGVALWRVPRGRCGSVNGRWPPGYLLWQAGRGALRDRFIGAGLCSLRPVLLSIVLLPCLTCNHEDPSFHEDDLLEGGGRLRLVQFVGTNEHNIQ